MQPSIEVVVDGAATVLRVAGELDVAAVDLLQGCLDEVRASGVVSAIVDLGGATFIDLAALYVLLGVATDGLALMLRRPSALTARVLEITGMARLLPVEDSVG